MCAGDPKEGTEPPRWFSNAPFVSNVRARGAALGVEFTLGCERMPNTLLAHALLELAGEVSASKQNEVAEILFRQYHTDGLYPDEENVVSAAIEAGLGEQQAREAITSKYRLEAVNQECKKTVSWGMPLGFGGGVPYFLIDGKRGGLSGAQEPAALLKAFER